MLIMKIRKLINRLQQMWAEHEDVGYWDYDDFLLPEWAERRSDGNYMEAGAQLATRDGRRCGNAYVDRVEPHDVLGQVAVVVTDMGNSFRMTAKELEGAFYPPVYIMRIEESRARRGVTPDHM